MKRLTLIILLLSLTTSVFAQKKTTIIGDAWVGVVESANETTREITVRHPDKTNAETFVGVLEDGYKVKLKDGTSRELLLSELKPGLRVRVFYKSKTRDMAGRQTKVQLINRIDFLGRDEYTRLREVLTVAPSTPVSLNTSGKFPTGDPLKIHVASEWEKLDEGLVDWAARWNKEEAAKYGRVEIVKDLAQADVSLVVFWGSDESILVPSMQLFDQRGNPHNIAPATAQFVTRDANALQVLWIDRIMLDTKGQQKSSRFFEKELEKRIKARLTK